jgi:hypothetical protein
VKNFQQRKSRGNHAKSFQFATRCALQTIEKKFELMFCIMQKLVVLQRLLQFSEMRGDVGAHLCSTRAVKNFCERSMCC